MMESKRDRRDIWKISSVILGICAIILLFFALKGERIGKQETMIPADKAGETLVEYLNKQTNGGVELVSSDDKGYLYEVNVRYKGQEIPVFITKDGKYFVQGAVALDNEPVMGNNINNANTGPNSPAEVTKSDKPIVESFIFSYCPYGLQFEKALFPVYELLKDKADFRIVAIGAMHGEYEKTESLRQISIEQLYGTDKLFAYLKEFNENTNIGSCRGEESCLTNYLQNIYSKLSIDKTKIENYMESDAEKIYNQQNSRASSLGVSGSPTFVVNGAQAQVNRSPQAIKEAICRAFNSPPEECSKALSTQSANPGFG